MAKRNESLFVKLTLRRFPHCEFICGKENSMDIDGVEFVKLAPRRSPPDKKDYVIEARDEKTGGWTAKIAGGMLFIESVPGTHSSLEAALSAGLRYIQRKCYPKTIYFRTTGGQKRVIRKTRYVRSY